MTEAEADSTYELKEAVLQFFEKSHDALIGARVAAEAAMVANGGEEALRLARREHLPLGEPLSRAVSRFAEHVVEEYTFTDQFGLVIGKRQLIDALISGSEIPKTVGRSEQDVRLYGDFAIMTSRVKAMSESQDQEGPQEYLETHTLRRLGDGWQILASQLTRIPVPDPLFLKAVDCDASVLSLPERVFD